MVSTRRRRPAYDKEASGNGVEESNGRRINGPRSASSSPRHVGGTTSSSNGASFAVRRAAAWADRFAERARKASGACGMKPPRTRDDRYRYAAACLAVSASLTCLVPLVLMAGIDDRGGTVPQYLRARRRGRLSAVGSLFGRGQKWTPKRRRPDADPVPLLIPRFGTGGAARPRLPKFGRLPGAGAEGKKDSEEDKDSGEDDDEDDPDFGGIDITFLEDGEARNIHRDEQARQAHVYNSEDFEDGNDDWVDNYYAYDDDIVRHSRCRRTSWHRLTKPTCNEFHAFQLLVPQTKYISHGYFRDVFGLKDGGDEDAVLKSMRFKAKKYHLGRSAFETTRMDALVMERLTASPRVVDIYGHCGTSVFTESLPVDVSKMVEPTNGYATEEEMDEDFGPRNELSPTEKLTLALEMAESLSELHGYVGGVIVHDDVQQQQFLRTKDGVLKINDFNRAEVMLWDENKQEYCKYKNGGGYGNYRAPEEWADEPLDEKIDIYSFGNNVYGILTGLEPFYTIEDDEVVHDKMSEDSKQIPFIDERYRSKRSFAEAKLAELLDKCWTYDPDERISIFEVVEFLRKAAEENASAVGKPRRNLDKRAETESGEDNGEDRI